VIHKKRNPLTIDYGQQPCVGISFGNCNQLSVECVCSNKDYITGLSCCVAQACSIAQLDGESLPPVAVEENLVTYHLRKSATLKLAAQICLVVGVKVQTSVACASTVVTPASTLRTSTSARTSGTGFPPSNSTDGAAKKHKTGLSGGATAAIAVVHVVGGILAAGLLWYCYRGRITNAALRFPKRRNVHDKSKT
jgi:hypothetical protein